MASGGIGRRVLCGLLRGFLIFSATTDTTVKKTLVVEPIQSVKPEEGTVRLPVRLLAEGPVGPSKRRLLV